MFDHSSSLRRVSITVNKRQTCRTSDAADGFFSLQPVIINIRGFRLVPRGVETTHP